MHSGLSLRPVKNRGIIFYLFIYIYIVHFDICTAFCPKCFLMAAGGSGRRKLQEGGNEPNFDSRFGGIEATGFVLRLTQYN